MNCGSKAQSRCLWLILSAWDNLKVVVFDKTMLRGYKALLKGNIQSFVLQGGLYCKIRKCLTLDLLLQIPICSLIWFLSKHVSLSEVIQDTVCSGWQSCWWTNLFLAGKQGKTLPVRRPISKSQPVIWNRPQNDGKQDAWLLFVGLAYKLHVKPVTEDKPADLYWVTAQLHTLPS